MLDQVDVIDVSDNLLSEQETDGKIDVVAWGSHGDGKRLSVDPDFQRFFGGNCVVFCRYEGASEFVDAKRRCCQVSHLGETDDFGALCVNPKRAFLHLPRITLAG